jgi:hypothetical protein
MFDASFAFYGYISLKKVIIIEKTKKKLFIALILMWYVRLFLRFIYRIMTNHSSTNLCNIRLYYHNKKINKTKKKRKRAAPFIHKHNNLISSLLIRAHYLIKTKYYVRAKSAFESAQPCILIWSLETIWNLKKKWVSNGIVATSYFNK